MEVNHKKNSENRRRYMQPNFEVNETTNVKKGHRLDLNGFHLKLLNTIPCIGIDLVDLAPLRN